MPPLGLPSRMPPLRLPVWRHLALRRRMARGPGPGWPRLTVLRHVSRHLLHGSRLNVNTLQGTSNNADFRRVIGYQCGFSSVTCRQRGCLLSARRPFQTLRAEAANVVGQVLQANLGARPHDADRAHDPTTRRGLLSSEHMFDAGANFTPVAVCFRLARPTAGGCERRAGAKL